MNNAKITWEKFMSIVSRDTNGIYNVEGNIFYYVNGALHRIDGPAVESKNGDKSWFINGELYLSEEGYKTQVYLIKNGLVNYE